MLLGVTENNLQLLAEVDCRGGRQPFLDNTKYEKADLEKKKERLSTAERVVR